MPDVTPIKTENGVPQRVFSCHTALVDGYVIEGHVPAEDIERLLKERPDVAGISVPGMPVGAPGMEAPEPRRSVPVPLAVIARHYDGLLRDFLGETKARSTTTRARCRGVQALRDTHALTAWPCPLAAAVAVTTVAPGGTFPFRHPPPPSPHPSATAIPPTTLFDLAG